MIEPCEEVKKVEQRYEKALDDMEKHYKNVLDKISAEIADIYCGQYLTADVVREMALDIIDKYKK